MEFAIMLSVAYAFTWNKLGELTFFNLVLTPEVRLLESVMWKQFNLEYKFF